MTVFLCCSGCTGLLPTCGGRKDVIFPVDTAVLDCFVGFTTSRGRLILLLQFQFLQRHREGRHCEEQRDVAAQLLGGDPEIRMQTNQ